jgi:WD40 repeat protein
MKFTKLIKSRNARCNVIRFSPCNKFLAVGTADHVIEVFNTQSYSKISTFKGHKEAITHLDWSKGSEVIASNSLDGELLHFNIREGTIVKPEDVRNEEWATFTRAYGWHVQGAWSTTNVLHSQRINYKGTDLIAVSDDTCGLKLYK